MWRNAALHSCRDSEGSSRTRSASMCSKIRGTLTAFSTQPMSSPILQTHSARVVATLAFKGDEKLAINIPSTGKVSESVISLKKEVVGFLSQHMAASNLANDEVDMLEEVVSDEEEVPKKGKKGQKRKR